MPVLILGFFPWIAFAAARIRARAARSAAIAAVRWRAWRSSGRSSRSCSSASRRRSCRTTSRSSAGARHRRRAVVRPVGRGRRPRRRVRLGGFDPALHRRHGFRDRHVLAHQRSRSSSGPCALTIRRRRDAGGVAAGRARARDTADGRGGAVRARGDERGGDRVHRLGRRPEVEHLKPIPQSHGSSRRSGLRARASRSAPSAGRTGWRTTRRRGSSPSTTPTSYLALICRTPDVYVVTRAQDASHLESLARGEGRRASDLGDIHRVTAVHVAGPGCEAPRPGAPDRSRVSVRETRRRATHRT